MVLSFKNWNLHEEMELHFVEGCGIVAGEIEY
jgi:hypothetical protein